MKVPNAIQWAKLWILLGVYLNIAGWGLSVLGHLDPLGYGVVGVGGLLGLGFVLKTSHGSFHRVSLSKQRWRLRHFFPAFFMLLCLLALIGGTIYAPNNYDAMTYRFPRILHWFTEHRWHWIVSSECRMNYSAVGFEWLMAPLFALTKSDRGFFLINILSYALLPGLTYATFLRLGIAKRTAWYWMWLIPCGSCFITQAGSIGNDSFATIYFLAAIYFTLLARTTRKVSDLWIGAMAIALLTAAKASNLPLVLPWLVAAWPLLRLLREKVWATAAVFCVVLMASFFPIAAINTYYAGKWTGDPINNSHLQIDNPAYGIWGNGLQLLVQNVTPPIMPMSQTWNQMALAWMDTPTGRNLLLHFPRLNLMCGEMDIEEDSGLGAGLWALLGISVIACVRNQRSALRVPAAGFKTGLWIGAASWVALLAYMSKMGSESAARLIASYYVPLTASLLILPGMAELTRKRWWKICAVLAVLAALPLVILNPSRPLWPALTFFKKATVCFPESRMFARDYSVYRTYRARADGLSPLRKYLSREDEVVGFIGSDDSEVGLWRPFGTRKVVDVVPANLHLFAENQWPIIAREEGVNFVFQQSLDQWLKATGGHVVAKTKLLQKASREAREWCVIKLEK